MMLTVETILKGTGLGPMQSVGQMQVIPLVDLRQGTGEPEFSVPELEVGTSGYGAVSLRNATKLPTIVPYGAGWVVKERAQDHAIGSGAFLKAGEHRVLKNAMCIQQSQPGLIAKAKHALTILPAQLRAKALAMRHVDQYSKLWEHISKFNTELGVGSVANLVSFLTTFEKQLDEFVAEFELVPRQIGAIVLVAGEVVGVERSPSPAYFASVWEPLVRVCFGSLAVASAKVRKDPPATRLPLVSNAKTLDALRSVLAELRDREVLLASQLASFVKAIRLERADTPDDTLGPHTLFTVAAKPHTDHRAFGGQVVTTDSSVVYASLVAA